MGHGIAELAALHEYDVAMRDIKQEFIDRGVERIRWSLDKLVDHGQLTRDQAEAVLNRIHPTLDLATAVKGADVVIEAILEDLELKKKVFAEVDRLAPPNAILASNTSALSITEMGRATKRKDRVVGMHFFNPPVIMQLVEVVRGADTSDATVREAEELSRALGKIPIVCRKDVPGFITTRTISPYMLEAVRIHEDEGLPIEAVDSAMRFKVGFPMGPFELADQVGLDLLVHGGKQWGVKVPRSVKDLVAAGKLGRKSGAGFYDYKAGRPKITPDLGKDFDPLRILAPVINVAAGLVEDGVAAAEEIDEAMRLGTAFPKGPLVLADELGIDAVVAELRRSKTAPAGILTAMVERGEIGGGRAKGFYGRRTGSDGHAMSFETIILAKDPTSKVATLTLNRPDRHNAITPAMVEEIDRALASLAAEEAARCLVITGAGEKAFSAGADVTAFGDVTKSHMVAAYSRRTQDTFRRLAHLPIPTIAAIDGYCFGGGLELALACDFRVASRRSKIGQTEVTLGLIPGAGGTQRLVKLIGLARAKELVLLGSRLSAEEAAAIGLVHRAVDNDAFRSAVDELARKLAKGPPIALRLAKDLLNRAVDMPLDAALEAESLAFGIVTSTEDIFEGIQAFMEKREPKFQGK